MTDINVKPLEKVLTMADIEATDDIEYIKVKGFKEGQVFALGSLSAGDLLEWVEANEEAKKTAGIRLVSKSLVDGIPGEDEGATGKRIGDDPKYLKIFKAKSHKVMTRLVNDILKLNGMEVKKDGTTTAEAEAKKTNALPLAA